MRRVYGDKPVEQVTGGQIAANNVKKREYEKEYLDYWNSAAGMTGTGRPVDAFLMP
jgi:amidase